MDRETKMRLDRLIPDRAAFDAPLAPLTTFGLGGPAEVLVRPESIDELTRVLKFIRAEDLPVFVLGGGSNVLFRDGGFPGVVIQLGRAFSRITPVESGGSQVLVEAGAAAPLTRLVNWTRSEGLSGVEFLAGIPGWVGGALIMNAGAQGGEISQVVRSITVVDHEGRLEELPREQLIFEYRNLELSREAVILKGLLSLQPSSPKEVEARIKEVLDRRRAGQPRGVKSAGCVFKNPSQQTAGRLIEMAGLKGRTVGQAWVADEHANFIVHRGRATAGEVIELLNLIRAEVKTRFGVELEPEIKIVGTDAPDPPRQKGENWSRS